MLARPYVIGPLIGYEVLTAFFLFNPSFPFRFAHMMTAAYLTFRAKVRPGEGYH